MDFRIFPYIINVKMFQEYGNKTRSNKVYATGYLRMRTNLFGALNCWGMIKAVGLFQFINNFCNSESYIQFIEFLLRVSSVPYRITQTQKSECEMHPFPDQHNLIARSAEFNTCYRTYGHNYWPSRAIVRWSSTGRVTAWLRARLGLVTIF
jgi:hypothetical protein